VASRGDVEKTEAESEERCALRCQTNAEAHASCPHTVNSTIKVDWDGHGSDLISLVHNDHVMIKHVFPHLEPDYLFSLEKSSQTVEAVYGEKSYWKVFIKYLLQQKKYDRVFQQYTESSPKYSREILEHSIDPEFF
jgi:hypothetical protein